MVLFYLSLIMSSCPRVLLAEQPCRLCPCNIVSLVSLVSVLFVSLCHCDITPLYFCDVSAMQLVWHQQLDLWQAWMEPLFPAAPQSMPTQAAGSSDMMQPWTEGDSTVAVTMVEMFKSTLLFTHATLASKCYCCVRVLLCNPCECSHCKCGRVSGMETPLLPQVSPHYICMLRCLLL